MSGWENVPEEAPAPPPAPRKPKAEAAGLDQASLDAAAIEDGQLARVVDTYWPHTWLLMLGIVCAIGIYKAIDKLPNSPAWWP